MSDNIRFCFSSATSVLKAINECDDSLTGLIVKFHNEIDKAGTWWEGPSYQAYAKLFDGPGGRKTIIAEVEDRASSLGSRLIRTAEKKREWEQACARKIK